MTDQPQIWKGFPYLTLTALLIRIVELEALPQAFARVIKLSSAVEIRQTLFVNEPSRELSPNFIVGFRPDPANSSL